MILKSLEDVEELKQIDTLHQLKPLTKEPCMITNTIKLLLLSQTLLLKGRMLLDKRVHSSQYLKYVVQANKIHKRIEENYIYSVDEMKQIKKDFKLRGL